MPSSSTRRRPQRRRPSRTERQANRSCARRSCRTRSTAATSCGWRMYEGQHQRLISPTSERVQRVFVAANHPPHGTKRQHSFVGLLKRARCGCSRTGPQILELAQPAYSLYVTQNPLEQARLLKTLLSSCTFDRGTFCPTYREPFDLFAQRSEHRRLAPQAGFEPPTLRLTALCRRLDSRVLHASSSGEDLLIRGVRQSIVQRLFSRCESGAGLNPRPLGYEPDSMSQTGTAGQRCALLS
jgi:hypothetical protein